MDKEYLVKILALILLLAVFYNCSGVPKTFKEQTLDDMYPILNHGQFSELKERNSDEQIIDYLNDYWNNIELPTGLSRIQIREEYKERLNYANEHFPDRRGWGRSDRKRVYLIYGPPDYIEKKEASHIHITKFATIKSLEIWIYMSPGSNNSLPSQGDEIHLGEKKFIFADMTGSGFFQSLYSSEDSEYFDSRILY